MKVNSDVQTFNKQYMTLLIHRCRAQNNFRTVAAHDDRSEKFLLGEVSLLTGQNIGKKVN